MFYVIVQKMSSELPIRNPLNTGGGGILRFRVEIFNYRVKRICRAKIPLYIYRYFNQFTFTY